MPLFTSTRLNPLRFSLQSAYRYNFDTALKSTPPLHALLPIPPTERLILLAIIDGAAPAEIRKTLGATQLDLMLVSPRMMLASASLSRSLREPFDSWPPQYTRADLTPDEDLVSTKWTGDLTGAFWSDRWGKEIEQCLQKLLYAEVAVCLFGDAVPEQLRDLTLKERAVAYCLLVESMKWKEIQELLGCTKHFIRSVIIKLSRLLEGGS